MEQSPATRVNFSFNPLIRGGMPILAGDEMEQMAALREQWFAQIEQAIEGAQRLAWQLGTRECTSEEARELYGRLEAARLELDALRHRKRSNQSLKIDPEWVRKLGLIDGPFD